MAENKAEEEQGWGQKIFDFFSNRDAKPEAAAGEAAGTATEASPETEQSTESSLVTVTPEEIEAYEPADVVALLNKISTHTDISTTQIEQCCKRLRVLCREPDNCKRCDEAGTALAVVSAMGALPSVPTVQLQALAALVNLCSGEANEHRKNTVNAGAMKAIVAAMNNLPANAEVQEMACIALQNCCYGEDPNATDRRKAASDEGAIEAVVAAMKKHQESSPMQEVGQATLRLIVHRVNELRVKALELGAQADWVKPISQGGGILSFRKVGFGTSRRKQKASS